jgi:hypothetical protein
MDAEEINRKEVISLVEEELNKIRLLLKEMVSYKGDTRLYRRARGSVLHDFYNACERVFEIIARRINGGFSSDREWHKTLLHQMTVAFKDIRPPVLSRPLAAELDEYLAFRHLFRNIYGFELDSRRLDQLGKRLPKVARLFQKEMKAFLKKL